MSNRTDIVVETDNAEGQVLLSASRVYDLTEDKTQDAINSEVGSSLTSLGNTLTQLDTEVDTVENGLAIPQTGNACSRDSGIPVGAFIFLQGHSTLADGIYQNTSGSIIAKNADFTNSNLTRCYQDTGALNTLSASIESAKIDVRLNLRRNFVSCATTLDIENAVAVQVASMGTNAQSSIIGVIVTQTGQKLSGGIWNGIIFKGDGSYYSVLFYTYQNFLRQYIYLNGAKTWYQYNPTAI